MTRRHITFLRETAKFLSGLIAADMLMGLWVISTNYSLSFFGIYFTPTLVYSWMTADLIIFLFLIHYAWGAKLPAVHPQKLYFSIAGLIFLVVGVLHFLRIVYGVSLDIGGIAIPYWLNSLGATVALFLSYASFHFAAHRG